MVTLFKFILPEFTIFVLSNCVSKQIVKRAPDSKIRSIIWTKLFKFGSFDKLFTRQFLQRIINDRNNLLIDVKDDFRVNFCPSPEKKIVN